MREQGTDQQHNRSAESSVNGTIVVLGNKEGPQYWRAASQAAWHNTRFVELSEYITVNLCLPTQYKKTSHRRSEQVKYYSWIKNQRRLSTQPQQMVRKQFRYISWLLHECNRFATGCLNLSVIRSHITQTYCDIPDQQSHKISEDNVTKARKFVV